VIPPHPRVRLRSSATPRRPRLRFVVLVAALLAALQLAPVLAGAQTGEIDDAKTEREDLRRQQAEVASELDPLLAEDAELEAAVAALNAHVATQLAKLDSIQQALGLAEREVDQAGQRVSAMQGDIDLLRGQLQAEAVEAYVNPGGDLLQQLLSSSDLGEAATRRALLDSVTTNQADVVDQLRAKEDELSALQEQAQAAADEVSRQQSLEEEQLVELETALEDQQRLREALQLRISEFQAEVDSLAAGEAAITARIQGLITDEDDRAAAQAQAAQINEQRAAQAAISATQTQAVLTSTVTEEPTDSSDPDEPATTTTTTEATAPPSGGGGMIWPTSGSVTSPFGTRWGRQHNGIDIQPPLATAYGTTIVAAKGGTVVSAGSDGAYGNATIIDHGGGLTTVYAHQQDIYVSSGQSVGQGTAIGTVGCSGSCTGPHLHFEVRESGVAYDPMNYL
jgi:murein DD-endopeptidase MepM/ murein hydrolase activator NlpD